MDIDARANWRVLYSAPVAGALNMAIDEAILCAVAARQVPPTIRLYAWQPPCLSLGRGQPYADVDLAAVRAAGFDLVRRSTGGRAILHIDELTYSVIAPETAPQVAGGIVPSYRRLSKGLVSGLEQLGVSDIGAEKRGDPTPSKGPVCFEVPSDYEITAGGRKLIGSAQMRARSVVLQHGAIPLRGDIARICAFLVGGPDRIRVRARATTIEDALGRRVPWGEVAGVLAESLATSLNLHLEPDVLTTDEWLRAEELLTGKYATDEWTRRA